MSTILVKDFKGLTDLPAYDRDPGYLRTLKNLRPRPDGYLEMRGGLERLAPASGTPANPISTGGYLGALDSPTPWGWVRTFNATSGNFELNGAASSANLALHSFILLWPGAVGDYLLIGADQPFSSVTIYLVRAATYGGGTTFVYEYGVTDPGGGPPTYSPLTTSEVFDLTTGVSAATGRATTASWRMPSNWIPTTEGNAGQGRARKYYIRVRLSAVVGWVQSPRLGFENTHVDWQGMHELFIAGGDPSTGSLNCGLYRYVENVSTADWSAISTTLFSGNSARQRMVSYRGVLYLVNGRDQKRFNGIDFSNIGLPAPNVTLVLGVGAGPATWTGGAVANLRFRYAVTSGWGSQQVAQPDPTAFTQCRTFIPTLLGESPPQFFTFTGGTYPNATAAGVGYVLVADAQQVGFNFTPASMPNREVDCLHVYRTDDLSNVPESAYESMPYFRIFTIQRDALSGTLLGGPGAYQDQRLDFPFPRRELDQTDTTPPPRCKLIWIHKNRNFYASSDRYPARVWWSDPYEPDVVDTDKNYEDFSTEKGGRVTAGAEFLNMALVFTEDQMYGIADVDVDQFQSFPIAPGVGCVAPDALAVSNGLAIWPAKDGFYAWNGEGLPRKISKDMDDTFSRMSYEGHGLSWARMHTNQYEVRFISLRGALGSMFRFDLITGKWFEITHGIAASVVPLCAATVPIGHSDYPRVHPIYGSIPQASDFNVYVGEQTTQDNGNAITCTADIHFGPMGDQHFIPDKAGAYYRAADGWAAPTLAEASTSAVGTDINAGSVGSGNPDPGADYSLVQAGFKQTSSGSQDVVVRFNVTSIANGTLHRQRLLAAFLSGSYTEPRRP